MSRKKPDHGSMQIWEHLEELRWAIFKAAGALLVGTVFCFFFNQPMLALLMRPSLHLKPPVEMIFTAPLDAFMTQFKVALLGGMLVASPLVLHFLAGFISPALTDSERRIARAAVGGGTLLFAFGIATGYATLHLMLPALMIFSLDGVRQMWNLKSYLDFCVRFMLGTGLVFEMPMVLTVLARLGLVKAEALTRFRHYAYIGIFVVAAIVTPSPDAFSQTLVGLPMVVLYEISIVLVRWQQRRRERMQS